MSRLPETPIIPDAAMQLRWQQDERLQDARSHMASLTLAQFMSELPDVERPDSTDLTSFVDLEPGRDYDRRFGIVWLGSYTHTWGPITAPGVKLFQNSLEVPARVIFFPSGVDDKHLDGDGQETVTGGDFTPLARPQLRTLDALGIERVAIIGASEGATIGAALLADAPRSGLVQVERAGLLEPTNTFARTEDTITDDFKGEGLKGWIALNRAINDSAIPLLSEAQHSRGGLDYVKQLIGFAAFSRRTGTPVNQAIMSGFGWPTFTDDLTLALVRNPDLRVLLGSGSLSRIAPVDGVTQIAAEFGDAFDGRVTGRVVADYGHEMLENLVVKTLVAKEAVEG